MTALLRISILAGLLVSGGIAWCATSETDPYTAYVYPAGGQQGTTFKVVLNGQRLKGVSGVFVTGSGVSATVAGYVGPMGPLNALQQEELKRRLKEIAEKRWPNRAGKNQGKTQTPPVNTEQKPEDGKTETPAQTAPLQKPAETTKPLTQLPDLPELRNLEGQTPKQLRALVEKFLNPRNRPKPPMAEELTLDVTIDPEAAPGNRELRVRTPAGLSNPLVFQVGPLPEFREPEDKDDPEATTLQPITAPAMLNGRILPGEVDRFPLQLRQGRQLAMVAEARALIPYLADAVPGWFQAVLALYDPTGKEVAFQDDCGFDPDPVLTYQVPKDGVYRLEIRDSIYRGRLDFVYRIAVGDTTQLRPLFPTESRGGVVWGIPSAPTAEHPDAALWGDKLPRSTEIEPDDTPQQAKSVTLPRVIDGCISRPGDVDVYQFTGRAGEDVVVETYARRMDSPLDSLLRIYDAAGRVVAWNDDFADKGSGLLTDQADSYISLKLPAAGAYYVQVSDAQRHGGQQYRYVLRIGPPQPDFALRMTPSSVNVPAGRAALITVYALRRDGYNGEIDVALKDAAGFTLNGGVIPAGRDSARMTLTAPLRKSDMPVTLSLEGRAIIGNTAVVRPVIPADEMMQAFAYYHLVPAQQLAVSEARGWISMSLPLQPGECLRIPAGGSAQITCAIRPLPKGNLLVELSDPPAGITLQEAKMGADGIALILQADDKHAGYADNLIAHVSAEIEIKRPDGTAGKKVRVPVGVLPAIPIEIVAK